MFPKFVMFFLVDAFTEIPFKGNPAGVCILDEYPSDFELQKIARYYNWSEIAFLKRLGADEFQLRWFSPLDEAPLCGHATLAASHIVFSNNLVPENFVNFKYKEGILSALKTDNGITMSFPAKPVINSDFPFSVSDVIGIKDYVEVVKDELLYVIVLKSKEDVFNAIPDFVAIEKVNCRAIAITAIGDHEFDFYSRYFAPKVGIFEDPVCGSMHCRLACYWNSVLGKNSFNAFQASKRSGVLHVELDCNVVKISGKAATICEIKHV